jgi:sec-independent protein translocase protein TatC
MAASNAQPFHQHVQELRRRLSIVMGVLVAGGAVGYGFHARLIAWLSAPLKQKLYYTAPSGGLQFTMQVCLLAGALIVLPVAIYHIIRFIQPAVHINHRNKITKGRMIRFIFFSYILALLGGAFAYFIVLPAAFHFFAGFSSNQVQSFITADKYFSFVIKCISTFAIIFQLPLIMLFIDRIRPIPPSRLKKARKWVVIGSFAVALILPFAYDPVTQLFMAAPMIVMYEVSIVLISIANHKREKRYPHFDPIAKNVKAPLIPIVENGLAEYTGAQYAADLNAPPKPASISINPIVETIDDKKEQITVSSVHTPRSVPSSKIHSRTISSKRPLIMDIIRPESNFGHLDKQLSS